MLRSRYLWSDKSVTISISRDRSLVHKDMMGNPDEVNPLLYSFRP